MINYNDIQNSLKDYYANLLIVQYNGKPKAKSTIKTFVDLFFVNMVLMQIRDAFDWTTAVGNQLDIIGKWVGCSRFYNGQLLFAKPYFSLIDWNYPTDNKQGGFSTYADFNTLQGNVLTYDDIQNSQNRLTDAAYRTMIGLKIIYNNIQHTAKFIDDAIWEYFEGQVYTTWETQTLIYHYQTDLKEILEVALEKGVLPCPIGCNILLREI